MRHEAGVAPTLLLAGAGSSLVAVATLGAALGVRQAARVAPIHPFGATAGLFVVLLGVLCWWAVRRHRDGLAAARFRAWSLREF